MMNESPNLTASILDRLQDNEPEVNSESAQYRVASEQQILDSVLRDLENLLNTRCSPIERPTAFKALKRSIIRYGLKDSSTENPGSNRVRQNLSKEIETVISIFEPRLKNPVVRVETRGSQNRTLIFRISGTLVVEPLASPVAFDTVLDLNRRHYAISK